MVKTITLDELKGVEISGYHGISLPIPDTKPDSDTYEMEKFALSIAYEKKVEAALKHIILTESGSAIDERAAFSELSAMLGHDFTQPISSVKGSVSYLLQLADEAKNLPDETIKLLAEIDKINQAIYNDLVGVHLTRVPGLQILQNGFDSVRRSHETFTLMENVRDYYETILGGLNEIVFTPWNKSKEYQKLERTANAIEIPVTALCEKVDGLVRIIDEKGTSEQKDIVSLLQNISRQYVKLAQDSASFMKILSEGKVTPQNYSLRELVQTEHDNEKAYAQFKGITIDTSGVQDVDISADRNISRVISNLLGNALKYSPQNTTINVFTVDKGDHYEVCVADQGYGIGKDVVGLVFEPFTRFHQKEDDSATSGSGLGLSMIKEVMQAHGRDVYVKNSLPGLGTTMAFTVDKAQQDSVRSAYIPQASQIVYGIGNVIQPGSQDRKPSQWDLVKLPRQPNADGMIKALEEAKNTIPAGYRTPQGKR